MTTATFTITRSANTNGAATLDYVVSGTGRNPATGADFNGGELPSGTVTFADGEATKVITLTFSTTATPGRTFGVKITDPSVGKIVGAGSAAGQVTVPAFSIAPG